MENVLNTRRIVEILLLLSIMYSVQWLMHPITEYESLLRRSKDVNRPRDIFLREDRRNDPLSEINLDGTVDVTLVIPAFNEAIRLPIMLDDTLSFLNSWCHEKELSYEIIIVDDASIDKTTEIASEYSTQHRNLIRILRLGENHGKGGAIKLGIQRARGKYILMVDADGATNIRDLDTLYSELQTIQRSSQDAPDESLGLVLGSRAHLQENSIATRAFYRTVLMRGFHVLVMLLCTRSIKDTQCGFKLFTRKTADLLFQSLHLERWAFDIEIIFLAEKMRIPMSEVAVRWHEVEGSKLIQSKLDIVTTSLTMARDMLLVRLAYTFGWWKIEA